VTEAIGFRVVVSTSSAQLNVSIVPYLGSSSALRASSDIFPIIPSFLFLSLLLSSSSFLATSTFHIGTAVLTISISRRSTAARNCPNVSRIELGNGSVRADLQFDNIDASCTSMLERVRFDFNAATAGTSGLS